MSIFDKIKSIRADYANHYFYGSLAGAVSAIVGVIAAAASGFGLVIVLIIGALSAFIGASIIAVVKEASDAKANEAAAADGKPPVHEVSRVDAAFTMLGSAPSVAVLSGMAAIAYYFSL